MQGEMVYVGVIIDGFCKDDILFKYECLVIYSIKTRNAPSRLEFFYPLSVTFDSL